MARSADLEAQGVALAAFAMALLEKVEELTLHAIAQDARSAALETKLVAASDVPAEARRRH